VTEMWPMNCEFVNTSGLYEFLWGFTA